MQVHTKIICQKIIPSAIGSILSTSKATGDEQLSLLFKLWYLVPADEGDWKLVPAEDFLLMSLDCGGVSR